MRLEPTGVAEKSGKKCRDPNKAIKYLAGFEELNGCDPLQQIEALIKA